MGRRRLAATANDQDRFERSNAMYMFCQCPTSKQSADDVEVQAVAAAGLLLMPKVMMTHACLQTQHSAASAHMMTVCSCDFPKLQARYC
jgi:hypothetical protein